MVIHRAGVSWHDGERAAIELECSAGTYVRQVVAGLGDAYCEELERTGIGPFVLPDADPERVVPLAEALSFMPERRLADEEARRARHGVSVPRGDAPDNQAVRLTHGEELLAVAEPKASELHPVVVFVG